MVKRCQAGLVHVLAPVIRDGLHIASLEGGQVFSRRPVEHDFQSVLERFPGWRERNDFSKLKAAYFQTPVLNGQQLRAALSLLSLISQSLTFDVLRHLATERTPRRSHMDRARAFVDENLVEPITLGKAARHVNLCPAYFCRLFRKETGQTFISYLAQARAQRAQRLLRCSSNPITEIGYAAGFQSIWHFNHVFKRLTGLTPTQYRRERGAAEGQNAPSFRHNNVAEA